MSNRIFRFGFTGVIFLLFIVFWYWELGGENVNMLNSDNNRLIAAVFAVVSLTGIGYFFSGLFKELWEWWPGPANFYHLPIDSISQDYYSIIKDHFPGNSGVKDKDGILIFENRKTIFLNHEILIRKEDKHKEAILFIERRFDTVYTGLNIFYSVLVSLPIAFFLTNREHWPPEVHLTWWKLGWLPTLTAYMIFTMLRCIKTIKEVNEFEHRLIIDTYRNKKTIVKEGQL